MQGPPVLTLTMAPFDSTSLFRRSYSSPNIQDMVNVDYQPANPVSESELPRSASYTFIPSLDGQYSMDKGKQGLMATTSEGKEDGGEEEKKPNKLTKEERPRAESVGRRKSLVARPKSWMQRVKSSPDRPGTSDPVVIKPVDVPPVPTLPKSVRDTRRMSVSESFATFARKSWISTSRSPSPKRIPTGDRKLSDDAKGTLALPLNIANSPKLEKPIISDVSSSPHKPVLRRTTTLQRLKQRPQSVLMNFTNLTSANSSTSSLPSSMDKSTPRTSTDKVPPVPKPLPAEKLHILGLENRRRDELWSAFRSLDNDFSKFQSKSWSLKTNIVRSALLPFLKNHMAHPSNINLRPEDLERRVTVMNKWWKGLLDVLDGRQNQTVSGVDRPILLEACYCIMIRPEWRAAPAQFVPVSIPLSRSPTRNSLYKKKSSASIQSTASQFIAESVYHNTRTFFVQNLLAQVKYAVDKMSLRHAPASLVTFCGKAVAFAFFFVPGIADALVRVWKLNAETLRRVADEVGLPKRPSPIDTEEISALFPEHLRNLGWTSPKAMVTSLRQPANLSIMAAKINWHGPWSARWCGRDSDLFFVFAKHFFVLAEDFLTPGLPLMSKSRAPGYLLVQAQILSVLDGIIRRQAPVDPLPATFDDVLAGADANAAALPLPSNNSARPMAENRLIMLLRDFLSEHPPEYDAARKSFAESFSRMMQASARKTSLFNHNACFVLSDFMEEATGLFVRFHRVFDSDSDPIDWYFWLDVCKKMLDSQNSMSEIRLFSLIHAQWNVLASDPVRREVICMDWLLTEESFIKYFCHWCPMVRAYYMRLLCWRLCRDDGDASDLDTKIFSTISTRLKLVFSHYLFLKQSAEKARILPPSTAPCHPAPGRRLLIIRNDNLVPSANIFMSFDGIIPTVNKPTTPSKRNSSLTILTSPDPIVPKLTADQSSTSPVNSKKRWSILGKTFSPFDSTAQPSLPSPPGSSSGSPPKNLDEVRRETALARTNRPTLPASKSTSDSTLPNRLYCFKFSLEWAQHFDRNSGSNSKRNNLMGERRIISPRLPSPAQACIGARVPGVGNEVVAKNPAVSAGDVSAAKYAGRALAEWALIVGECNNFVERRRKEGVPSLRAVEVPVLGVEGFRRFGG